LAFLIVIINDEYKIKSIDKQNYKFPGRPILGYTAESNFDNDAAKRFESFVSSDFEVHRTPVATYTFRSQKS